MQRRALFSRIAALSAAAAGRTWPVQAESRLIRPQQADNIILGQSLPIDHLDPASGRLYDNGAAAEAALCIYDRLLEFDDKMAVVPGLASSFDLAADLRSLTLRLRPKLSFHNGTTLDSQAVRVNLERLMSRERPLANRSPWDRLSHVETPDALTVVVHASVPCVSLPAMLAGLDASIIAPRSGDTRERPRAVDRDMAQMADIPAGAGPYRVETFSHGAELIVRPFERYWGGPPPVRRLFFRAIPQDDRRLRAINIGAVDVIDALPPNEVQALTRNPVLIPLATTSLCAMGFAFNVNHRTLSDPRVRQALNLAVPTQAIIQKLFYGFAEPLTSPLAPNAAGHITAGRTGFDLAKAKSLLTAAGWKQGDEPIRVRDGVRLSLTLLCPEGLFPADRAVAEAVATALRLVGVDVRIEGIAADTYLGRLRGDLAQAPWDLALLGFTPPQCSSVAQLQALFASASGDLKRPDGWNIGHYQSQQVDSALDRAASAPSAAARSAGLAEAQRLIWQDMPWLWLFAPANVSAVRKPVAGVEVLPTGYTSIRRSWS